MALSEVDRLTRPYRGQHTARTIGDLPFETYTPPVSRSAERLGKVAKWLRKTGGAVASGLRVATVPTLRAAKDHIFTVAAFICADWAAFLWNAKAGLITAAILFIAFELKVSR